VLLISLLSFLFQKPHILEQDVKAEWDKVVGTREEVPSWEIAVNAGVLWGEEIWVILIGPPASSFPTAPPLP
jgi:hypothetical protein